ncbi:MAG: hypothetical protein U0271_07100 [Polyangiaceae bacterium]
MLGALLLSGCGARDDLATGGAGGQTNSGTQGGSASCEADGIRMCGANDCPPIGFDECPGIGCTPTGDRTSLEPLDVGVCWPDIPEWVNHPCFACEADEVCVHDTLGGLFCAPFELCSALWDSGATTACRYADKSPFVNEPWAQSPYCPHSELGTLCGGTCPPCVGDDPCVGRSAEQPFGVCVSQLTYAECSATNPGACLASQLCAVFAVDPDSQPVADRFGLCLHIENCRVAEAAGLVHCLGG